MLYFLGGAVLVVGQGIDDKSAPAGAIRLIHDNFERRRILRGTLSHRTINIVLRHVNCLRPGDGTREPRRCKHPTSFLALKSDKSRVPREYTTLGRISRLLLMLNLRPLVVTRHGDIV